MLQSYLRKILVKRFHFHLRLYSDVTKRPLPMVLTACSCAEVKGDSMLELKIPADSVSFSSASQLIR